MPFKVCLFTESLTPPFDEGIKNFTYNLFHAVPASWEVMRLGFGATEIIDRQISVNKLLLPPGLRRAIREFRPDAMIYVPVSSITPNSFVRSRILKRYAGNVPLAMIGLQPRRYSRLLMPLLRAISPDVVYVQSHAGRKALADAGFNVAVIHAGVDAEKFRPVEPSEKARLRAKYGIDTVAFVALHVGHIKERRNLRVLAEAASDLDAQLVVVGSTSTLQDAGLAAWLSERGARILNDYIEHIEEVYRLADLYIFPVVESVGAIELPLSVLEAMSCNLPVVTTKFGGLTDCFQEGDGLYFAKDSAELIEKLKPARAANKVQTRSKVEPFTWHAVAERFFSEIEQLAAGQIIHKVNNLGSGCK